MRTMSMIWYYTKSHSSIEYCTAGPAPLTYLQIRFHRAESAAGSVIALPDALTIMARAAPSSPSCTTRCKSPARRYNPLTKCL